MNNEYLSSAKDQFKYYQLLGQKTFDQLSENDIFWKYNEESNSIAVIVKHLWGNMLSRWTDFLTSDGEKEWRDRDGEFMEDIQDKNDLIKKWDEGWSCLFDALDSINEENFDTIVYIRNVGHTVQEAIHRQTAHYAYHVGQIVFVGRMVKGKDWINLSVPKGQSTSYNQKMFSKPKRKEHFTKGAIENLDGNEDS